MQAPFPHDRILSRGNDVIGIVTIQFVRELYQTPFLKLVAQASRVHEANHTYNDIQRCTLLSVKTGGCPEDCAYCPQAARYHTGVKAEKLMRTPEVLEAARNAKANGATRFCMGAAWREVRDGRDFDEVLEMVRGVTDLGLEACATLGMLTESQAQRLKEAGLYAYNHNLNTSRTFIRKLFTRAITTTAEYHSACPRCGDYGVLRRNYRHGGDG